MPFAGAWSERRTVAPPWSASCCKFREGKGFRVPTRREVSRSLLGGGVPLLPGRDYIVCRPALRRSTALNSSRYSRLATRYWLLAFGSRRLELITLLPADRNGETCGFPDHRR